MAHALQAGDDRLADVRGIFDDQNAHATRDSLVTAWQSINTAMPCQVRGHGRSKTVETSTYLGVTS
jgi:hypothetical protein